MPQRLEDILEQNIVLQWRLFGDFDSQLLHIERTVVASDTLVVERLVERNNTAVVERIVLDTDTAVVAVAVAVIVLVDTHTDSFSVAFQAKNV